MLQTYSYPGNVRELENMIERAVLMARGRVIMPVTFPPEGRLVDCIERLIERCRTPVASISQSRRRTGKKTD